MADGVVLRVAVSGALGSMGRMVCSTVMSDPDLEFVGAVDPAYQKGVQDGYPPEVGRFTELDAALSALPVDVVVDFTRPEAVKGNILACLKNKVPAVVGTTGLTSAELEELRAEAEAAATPIFVAPNFAIGAVLMMLFSQAAAKQLKAGEIIELHHDRKLDAPSGTAKRTALLIEDAWNGQGLDRQVPIHSVRLPGLLAHQEVIFGGLAETLTIRHDSFSRECFMPGVVLAVKRIKTLQGLVVGLENIL